MVCEQKSRTTNGSKNSRRASAARKATLLQAVTVCKGCIAMLDAFAPACSFRARSYRLALVVNVRRRWYALALAWSLSHRGHAIDGSTVGQHANHPPAVTRLMNRGGVLAKTTCQHTRSQSVLTTVNHNTYYLQWLGGFGMGTIAMEPIDVVLRPLSVTDNLECSMSAHSLYYKWMNEYMS